MNQKLLSYDELLSNFINSNSLTIDENYDCIILHLKNNINPTHSSDEERNRQADRWLEWVHRKDHLKAISADIPDGILPRGFSGSLIDVKVFTKHGPDDKIYDRDEEIRKKVARGNCILELVENQPVGLKITTDCVIYAMKKFTGGLYDDDDRESGDNYTWKKYFVKPIETAKMVTSLKKANGEAAHVSVRNLNNQFYICAGSKNVHLLFRNKDHIDLYTQSRYLVAKQVCHTIWNFLNEMTEEQQVKFLSFLHHTQFTAIFEILQPTSMHVEDLSYLIKPRLVFITWMSNDLECVSHLCCMPPAVAIEIAKVLGLFTVEYDTLPPSEVEERILKIRRSYGYEGEVLYFQDEQGDVIGLLKKKTVWYVVIRAIREKIRYASREMIEHNFSILAHGKKIEKRIGEIQTWLQFDDECRKQWQEIGVHFLKWCHHGLNGGKINRDDLASKFPAVWKRFLDESKRSDCIPTHCVLATSPD